MQRLFINVLRARFFFFFSFSDCFLMGVESAFRNFTTFTLLVFLRVPNFFFFILFFFFFLFSTWKGKRLTKIKFY